MASDDDKKKAQGLVEQAGRLLVSLQNEPEHKTQLANKAIGLLDEAITLDPENDEAWFIRGDAKNTLSDHQGAIEDSTKAIALKPDNENAWNNRGIANHFLGDYHGAITDFDEALRLNPYNESIQKKRLAAEIALKRRNSQRY